MVTLRPSSNTAVPSAKQSSQSSKVSCGKCHRMGHRSGECPLEGTLAEINAAKEDEAEMKSTSVAFASTSEREARYKQVEEKFGRCRLCDKHHT